MFFYLSLFFVSCEFCWVRCSLNSITHFAAKFDAVHKARFFFFFFGNNCNLPLPVLEDCKHNCCTAFVSV